eukprot:scaffold174524_cov13-Prasinocladus_malaysianus.AAC.1
MEAAGMLVNRDHLAEAEVRHYASSASCCPGLAGSGEGQGKIQGQRPAKLSDRNCFRSRLSSLMLLEA